MKAIAVRTPETEWRPAHDIYGPQSVYDGQKIVQVKVLSDRRAEGGGIAFLVKFSPPQGKLIKLIAVARSDEHVYVLEGGYCNRVGKQLKFPGDYGLNPLGHPHSAFVDRETVALIVNTGEPDQVSELGVVDIEAR